MEEVPDAGAVECIPNAGAGRDPVTQRKAVFIGAWAREEGREDPEAVWTGLQAPARRVLREAAGKHGRVEVKKVHRASIAPSQQRSHRCSDKSVAKLGASLRF